MVKDKKFDIVLIASSNFKNIGHSKLNVHIISEEFAKRGHRILFVESLGLKNMPLGSRTAVRKVIKRLVNFMFSWFRGPMIVNENIYVISPIRLPFEKFLIIKKINEFIIYRYIKKYTKFIGKPFLLWLFLPTQYYLIKKLKPFMSVYYAVDDYSEVPGVDKKFVLTSEKKTASLVDKVYSTSKSVAERLQKYYAKGTIKVLPNVANVTHFSKAFTSECLEPNDLKQFRDPKKPLVLFYGNLAGYKLDLQLLYDIASRNPDIQFFLVGAIGLGDKRPIMIEKIKKLQNVALPGPRPYEMFPCYTKYADVGLLMSKNNKAILGGFPMKYFEYMAGGLPIVTPDRANLYPHIKDPKLGSIYADAKSFREAVFYWFEIKKSEKHQEILKYRLNYVKNYSWSKRIEFFKKEFAN